MLSLIFIFLLSCVIGTGGEVPKSICANHKPFRTNTKSCADFNEICIKEDDADCKNFQTACKQCPPSNYSILMYMGVMNMKNQIMTTENQIKNLTGQFESTAGITNKMIGLLITILVVNFILILLLIFEVRFKLISRCLKGKEKYYRESPCQASYSAEKNDNEISYQAPDSTDHRINLNQEELQNYFKKYSDLLNTKFNAIIQYENDLTVRFQMDGSEEVIMAKISPRDTGVKVKRKICHQISGTSRYNYKIMKMKYKENNLEDNKCFLFQFPVQENVIIKCELDEIRKPKGILVLRIRDFNDEVKLYQFNKNQTVNDVIKDVLTETTEGVIVLKGKRKLENTDRLAKCDLEDDSLLTLIKSEIRKLNMNSMFNEDQSFPLTYCTTDPIKNILENIANQMNTNMKNLVLFIDRFYLDKSKYLYEYAEDFQSQPMQICIIKKFSDVKLGKLIYNGSFYELYEAEEKIKDEKFRDKKILIKKYNTENSKFILKELATFQITKVSPNFIKISNVYNDADSTYIAIEYMSKGVMAAYLSKTNSIDIRLIQNWSHQILKGLQFLHENDTIVRDLNPTNILIDANDSIKLFNFNYSKYTNYSTPSSSLKNSLFVRYLAPEILNEATYDSSVDIWSFGVLVIKIQSGKELYADLETDKAIEKISKGFPIQYELSQPHSQEMEDFIIKCLKLTPSDRASISQLISDPFIPDNLKKGLF